MSYRENEINPLTSCIIILEQYSKPNKLSTEVTLLSSMLMLYLAIANVLSLFWMMALLGIIVLGIIEIFFAIKVGIDLALLRKLVRKINRIESSLTAIDSSLTKLHLMPSNKTGRSLDVRLLGCIQLFKTQIGLCLLQLITLVIAAVLHSLLA